MKSFQCLRIVSRQGATVSTQATLLRPSIRSLATPQRYSLSISNRSISLFSPRRPVLQTSPPTSFSSTPSTATNNVIPSPESLDLASKISSHPALGSTQIRCGPRDTYNPSHLVRKRRHGFLARLKSKKGRKLLMRRIKKGRWNLSH